MGRRVKFFLAFCLLFALPLLVGFAPNVNEELHTINTAEAAEDILGELDSVLPEGVGDSDSIIEKASGKRLVEELLSALSLEVGGAVAFFSLALGAAILLSLSSLIKSEASGALRIGIAAAVALPLWRSLLGLTESLGATLGELSELFLGISGVICSLTLSSGAVSSASVQAAGFSLTLSVFGGLGGAFLGELMLAVAATSLLGAVLGGRCESLSRGVRSVFNFGLGLATAALLGVLSLQTYVAASADSAALRAARYAASGMIPVVGTTVSGALSTLASGLSYVGGVVGGASVLAIILVALAPAVRLLLFRLALSLVLVFLDFTDSEVGRRLFGALRAALDAVIAVYFLSSVVYIFEIVLFTKSVVELL